MIGFVAIHKWDDTSNHKFIP